MTDQQRDHEPKKQPLITARRLKIAGIVLVLVLVGILIWQNRAPAEVRIFFAQPVIMPRALLLIVMLAIGFALGAVSMWSYGRRRR